MLATSVDTNKRGFVFRVWQNELTDHGNQTSAVKDILAAAPQDIDGSTLENDAYLDEAGPASGSGKLVGHLAEYEIPTVINLNGQVIDGMENGNFLPDDQMPGIQATGAATTALQAKSLPSSIWRACSPWA